jgi:hypothetical protein
MAIYKAVQSTANRENRLAVFLAGSIENGSADNWQQDLSEFFDKLGYDVYNPRRDAWDSSWEQSVNNPQFVEQVSWELEHLNKAEIILFYFQPGTLSPISLLELGLHARVIDHRRNIKVYVVCPEGFWRKGNVDIVCDKYSIPVFKSIEDLKLEFLKIGNL